ncbi:MAG: hypothetical protein KDN05_18800 [Verrucomicrobiae bacterium]|nr:hypothetical protein [Verrucomicrobiae bacterium]
MKNMPNITEDLRRYRELSPLFSRFLLSMLGTPHDPEFIAPDDPRILEHHEIGERLREAAITYPSVIIKDRELHQLFGQIRNSTINNAADDSGFITSDDLYEFLLSEYSPHEYARRLVQTKPIVTLTELPHEVIELVSEARRAYCLRLPTACISVCRSAIECAVVNIAVRIGRIKPTDTPHQLTMCAKISSLIGADLTSKSPFRRELDEFMAESSSVIHNSLKPDEDHAFRIFTKTLELAQRLYGYYSAQLK